MRVVILVASCTRPPYDALLRAQIETWACEHVDGAPVTHYFSDDLPAMTGKLRDALRTLLRLTSWDYVFRTNASSYVDKARLLTVAETLPRARCYAGVDGGGFASGSGFFISRDAAGDLAEKLPERSSEIDDVVVGGILRSGGYEVAPLPRVDYELELALAEVRGDVAAFEARVRTAHHVRCKHAADRTMDVRAMRNVHKIKTS